MPTSQEGVWQAKAGSSAAGKMDMLSVLLHEYGHALGLEHSNEAGDFMSAALQPGQRRMPTADQLQLMAELVADVRSSAVLASGADDDGHDRANGHDHTHGSPRLPDQPGQPNPSNPFSMLGLLPLGLMRRSDGSFVKLAPSNPPSNATKVSTASAINQRAQDYLTSLYPRLQDGSFQTGLASWEAAGAVTTSANNAVATSNTVTQLVLTPLELINRIAQLVPPPRTHRHRYYGVLAPNSPLRGTVTAMAQPVPPAEVVQTSPMVVQPGTAAPTAPPTKPKPRPPAHYLWAALIARIYEVFPLICANCGGRSEFKSVHHVQRRYPQDSESHRASARSPAHHPGTRATAVG